MSYSSDEEDEHYQFLGDKSWNFNQYDKRYDIYMIQRGGLVENRANVKTLEETESHLDEKKPDIDKGMIREFDCQARRAYRWRCIFICLCILSFIVISGIIVIMIFNLFFKEPVVYIDQLQIWLLPIANPYLGFRLIFRSWQPNIFGHLSLMSVGLRIRVMSSDQSSEYFLTTVSSHNVTYQENDDSWVLNRYIEITGDNKTLIMDTIVREQNSVGFAMNGHVNVKVSNLVHTIPVNRVQLYSPKAPSIPQTERLWKPL